LQPKAGRAGPAPSCIAKRGSRAGADYRDASVLTMVEILDRSSIQAGALDCFS
jgi:hypothetical protein